jgi:ABC-type uncharacterized transport system substrate-binding protein
VESARSEPFRLVLRELGYIDGQNISTEYRYSEGKNDRLPELAAELVRLKVDIIVAGGVPLVRAAMNATKTIPIVMLGQGSDPVEAGLIDSLARPGGNVTGRESSHQVSEKQWATRIIRVEYFFRVTRGALGGRRPINSPLCTNVLGLIYVG